MSSAHITTQGLVLREVDYRETDKILTVLTAEGGRRTVKARGCRRKGSPLAASAQLLVYSDMTLFEYRDHFTLNEAESLQQFWHMKQDVVKLSLASYFAEVMETVAVEGRPDPAALSLILNALYALDQLNKPLALVKAAYELRLMCLAGYEPLVDACAVCGVPEPEGPRFHRGGGAPPPPPPRGGGGGSVPLTAGAVAAMRHIVYGNPKRLFSFQADEASLACLGRACEGFLITQLDRGFRTLDFYHQWGN